MTASECGLSLSNKRKRFREKIALVWRVEEDPFGGNEWPNVNIRQHTKKCKPCLLYGMFGARSNSGSMVTFQESNVLLLWMPRGHVVLASAV